MKPMWYLLSARIILFLNQTICLGQFLQLIFLGIPMSVIVVFGTFLITGISRYLDYLLFEKYQVTVDELMGE